MLKGVVSPSGEVSIRGQMNPLASDLSLDMALQFRQLELSSLTPYAARFAGYRIDRGKLDLDLNYQIQKRQLKAENKVVLRQLRLGEKVDSPESIGLPLKLAVAILRDVDDNIDIDLPLSGSLDNPEFSIGPIIWQAFVNLLQRAITAPFSVLGNLIGGDGGSLGEVPFAVGSSELSPAARDNLGKLEKVLSARPALQLEVRGLSDTKADRAALQRQKVEAAVAQRLQITTCLVEIDFVQFARYLQVADTDLRLQPGGRIIGRTGIAGEHFLQCRTLLQKRRRIRRTGLALQALALWNEPGYFEAARHVAMLDIPARLDRADGDFVVRGEDRRRGRRFRERRGAVARVGNARAGESADHRGDAQAGVLCAGDRKRRGRARHLHLLGESRPGGQATRGGCGVDQRRGAGRAATQELARVEGDSRAGAGVFEGR